MELTAENDNSARCFVQALIQQAEEQSLDPEKSLRRAAAAFQSKTGDSFRENMDEEEPGRKLEMCIGVAFENAGVSLD